MARSALKMTRERLVANVKGGEFGPRASLSHLHPRTPPPGRACFETVWTVLRQSPAQKWPAELGESFFGPAAKSI